MNKTNIHVHDVLGIGFGPANIALAIAAEELKPELDLQFIEKNEMAGWQEEMLLPESDIQNHPLRDLVTPRNPRSRYTFINFLFENGRLFEHLNLPLSHPLRLEYRQYVTWVAQHFKDRVRYSTAAESIVPVLDQGQITSYCVRCSNGQELLARAIVLAPGRTPLIPQEFEAINDSRVIHFTQFLSAFKKLQDRTTAPRIAVIGGSQTAVELILHITNALPRSNVLGVNRNFGFRLKDTSPFSDEVYFPEFVNLFFNATQAQKEKLRSELVFTNYSSSDRDVLDTLYVQMYRNKISGHSMLEIKNLTTIKSVSANHDAVHLCLEHCINSSEEMLPFDLVILATGFKDIGGGPKDEPYPKILDNISPNLELNNGVLNIDLDYRVRLKQKLKENHAPLFLNGLCESSHGMGDSGSFSLLSLRSASIVNSLSDHFSLTTATSKNYDNTCRKAGVEIQPITQ